MKLHDDIRLSFDDVLLLPRRSRVSSRLDPSLKTRLTKNISIDIPLVSAAMDTVTDAAFSVALSKLGGAPFLHRFMSDEETVDSIKKIKDEGGWVIPSVGMRDDIVSWCLTLQEVGVPAVSFDIAHGHLESLLRAVESCKRVLSVDLIGGNVCTVQGTIDLINAGVDAVKANVGPGHACTTRITTGVGNATFSTITSCCAAAKKHCIPVISDGGMRTSGDIAKNLAAGAESCMLGFIFSQAEEAPGENIMYSDGRRYKSFRGMASREAQRIFKGGLKTGTAAEGEAMLVPVKGPLNKIVEELLGGIRSCMSYCDALSITELQEKAEFVRISPASYREGTPHGLEIAKGIK